MHLLLSLSLTLSLSLIQKSGVNKVGEAWKLFPGADSRALLWLCMYKYFKFPCCTLTLSQGPFLLYNYIYELELATNFMTWDYGRKNNLFVFNVLIKTWPDLTCYLIFETWLWYGFINQYLIKIILCSLCVYIYIYTYSKWWGNHCSPHTKHCGLQ